MFVMHCGRRILLDRDIATKPSPRLNRLPVPAFASGVALAAVVLPCYAAPLDERRRGCIQKFIGLKKSE
jgi:hypothetical protein